MKFSIKKGNEVVVGGGDFGCETACHLADNGFEVTIVEILPKLMEENIMNNVKVQMFALLEEKNINIMTGTKLNAVTDDGVEITLPNGKAWEIEADLVAIAVGMKKKETFTLGSSMSIVPTSGVVGEMAMKCDEVHLIGDCATRQVEQVKGSVAADGFYGETGITVNRPFQGGIGTWFRQYGGRWW